MKSHFVFAALLSCLLLAGNVVAQNQSQVPTDASAPTPIVQDATPVAQDAQAVPMENNAEPVADAGAAMSYSTDGCGCSSGVMSYTPDSMGGFYDSGCCNSGYRNYWGGWRRSYRPARFGGWRFNNGWGCCGY